MNINRKSQSALSLLEWSRGCLERVEACPACGSRARLGEPLVCADHRTDPHDERWVLHRCASCRSLYLDPRPDAESLPRAYESYYTHSVDEERPATSGLGGLLWRAIHGYLNRRFGLAREPVATWGYWLFWLLPPLRLKLDYYGRHLFADDYPQRGRLLDVGCGNGTFLARAREMGWAVTGLEPDAKAVAVCHQRGLDVLEGDLSSCPDDWRGAFDVVTMSHAIEHVTDPQANLAKLYELIKSGGIVWIALPNPNGLGSYFFESSWRELHPPYHLSIPSKPQMLILLERVGFVKCSFHRIGARNRRALRESAENALERGGSGMRLKAAMLGLMRISEDLWATLSARGGEETVITAEKPIRRA